MNNAEKFREIFGAYATEVWAKTEDEFLDWLNEEKSMSDRSNDERMTNIISWEEFKKREPLTYNDYEITNIQCPDCGELIFRYTKIVLSTYPPTHRYKCLSCGWTGTA